MCIAICASHNAVVSDMCQMLVHNNKGQQSKV